ncbi:hypothetical protein GCM10009839_43460 [Catenulispora yoronensis]|uniref:Uncharacterized protein n=1 Tax=Catenulispora yoronensis TaxID=450799 RepID=A0ABN2UHV3_9ACTN
MTPSFWVGAASNSAKIEQTGDEHCMKAKVLPAFGSEANFAVPGKALGCPVYGAIAAFAAASAAAPPPVEAVGTDDLPLLQPATVSAMAARPISTPRPPMKCIQRMSNSLGCG